MLGITTEVSDRECSMKSNSVIARRQHGVITAGAAITPLK